MDKRIRPQDWMENRDSVFSTSGEWNEASEMTTLNVIRKVSVKKKKRSKEKKNEESEVVKLIGKIAAVNSVDESYLGKRLSDTAATLEERQRPLMKQKKEVKS